MIVRREVRLIVTFEIYPNVYADHPQVKNRPRFQVILPVDPKRGLSNGVAYSDGRVKMVASTRPVLSKRRNCVRVVAGAACTGMSMESTR